MTDVTVSPAGAAPSLGQQLLSVLESDIGQPFGAFMVAANAAGNPGAKVAAGAAFLASVPAEAPGLAADLAMTVLHWTYGHLVQDAAKRGVTLPAGG
jgi:hypothetical protein